MIITSVELREIRLPLIHFFETSFGRTIERRIILARVIDRDGAEGWGECTCGEGPFYSDEWTDPAWATLKGRKEPRFPLEFVRIEPYVVPKRSLTGESTERVDTRVLQVLYSFEPAALNAYVGQQMDVFIEAAPVGSSGGGGSRGDGRRA